MTAKMAFALIVANSQIQQPLLVAVDGRSGVGKSTLVGQWQQVLDAAVVGADDFYAGGSFDDWRHRSPAEKAMECIDYQRLCREALIPLRLGQEASWYPFDFQAWKDGDDHDEHGQQRLQQTPAVVAPRDIVLLDGNFSGRPELDDLIDLRILVTLPDDIRRQRLQAREGEEMMCQWHQVWDEAEEWYVQHVCLPQTYDAVIDLSVGEQQ